METFIGCELWPGYCFSDQGTIIGKHGRPLKPCINPDGYGTVCLQLDDGQKTYRIHRLIAIAFKLPNPDNKPEIDHINRIKTDNRLVNLRWANDEEQQMNTSLRSTNTTGVKGLYYRKDNDSWRVIKTILGVSYRKDFKSRPEAEAFLEEISRTH